VVPKKVTLDDPNPAGQLT